MKTIATSQAFWTGRQGNKVHLARRIILDRHDGRFEITTACGRHTFTATPAGGQFSVFACSQCQKLVTA